MIYQHYKGDIYYLIGYAVKLLEDLDALGIGARITKKVQAIHTEMNEAIDVFVIDSDNFKGKYFVYKHDLVDGIHCFYKDLNGTYWLESKDKFFEKVVVKVNNGNIVTMPKNKKITVEDFFNYVVINNLTKQKWYVIITFPIFLRDTF